jgi:hypothetical protein
MPGGVGGETGAITARATAGASTIVATWSKAHRRERSTAPVFLDDDRVTVYKARVVKPPTGAFHQGTVCDGDSRRLG